MKRDQTQTISSLAWNLKTHKLKMMSFDPESSGSQFYHSDVKRPVGLRTEVQSLYVLFKMLNFQVILAYLFSLWTLWVS